MIQALLGRLSLGVALASATVFSAVAGAGGPCGGLPHNLPEPASLAILGAGVAAVLLVRKRLRRK
ncbi:MAG: PEP-CTERM sorting domain-containing protein [Gemmatimonadaceae bacterium]|nr:PEP-CTERM sorting domain-containing protein [Acetobacteraceae bacterium]